MTHRLEPVTPGEILLEEFMTPLGVSQNKLARDIDVPVTRIHDIVRGRRGITADTALRLSVYFGNSAEFWLNLQSRHDLVRARMTLGDGLKGVVRPLNRAG